MCHSGTTWMQEIVWLVCNNADIKAAKETRLIDRFGFVDLPQLSGAGIGLQGLENWPNDKRRYTPVEPSTWISRFAVCCAYKINGLISIILIELHLDL